MHPSEIAKGIDVAHQYYSQRQGTNPHPKGLPLRDVIDIFVGVYLIFNTDGYFDEAFGFLCVDEGNIQGKVPDPPLEMLLAIRKKNLWPIHDRAKNYSEDDFFDVIEFLYQHVSKPIDGTMHDYNECGMHWETFNQAQGRQEYREKINELLAHYEHRYELSKEGEVLRKPEAGFEQIFDADIPTNDNNVTARVDAAVLRYRRHGSTLDDRRQAVRDLADVLEYLRPKVKKMLTREDERDLFNIANNFEIRHHNEKQRTGYDKAIWLSWMFYFYLSTIHVVLRKINLDVSK